MNKAAFLFGLAVAAFFLALIPLSSWPAQAQQVCDTRQNVLAQLRADYGEVPVALGVAASSAVIEVLAAPGGKTWTIIITHAPELACVLAVGTDWRQVAPLPQGQPMGYWPTAGT